MASEYALLFSSTIIEIFVLLFVGYEVVAGEVRHRRNGHAVTGDQTPVARPRISMRLGLFIVLVSGAIWATTVIAYQQLRSTPPALSTAGSTAGETAANPTQLVAPPPAPPRLPEQKKPPPVETQLTMTVVPQAPSPLLRLTDATRWRFVTSFWDGVSATGIRPHCSATVSVKMDQPDISSIGRAERLWDELQPLLSYSNWQISGGGLGGTSYRGGITILVGAGGGDPLICGAQLAEELQSRTPLQVSIRKNQVTPKLEECKYECVEIQVGDAVVR